MIASSRILACVLTALFAPCLALADSLPEQEIPATVTLSQTIDLTAPAPDLWARIKNGFAMPELENDLVWRYQQKYQSYPDYLRRVVEQSRPYLHYVVEKLEMRGMPLELAFLPMVESTYNPFAYSSAHAAGLWQFIPATGKRFELEQNWWRDQRRDVVASTRAALDYLELIYEMHGDWHLALASYNWGEGAVGQTIARNRAKNAPIDYANLTMPKETRHYIPKLQALKNILGDPQLRAKLDLPSIPNLPHFHTLTIQTPMDLALAARLAGMSPDEFFALNPGYNRPVIPAGSTLVIPAGRLSAFDEGLRQHSEPLSDWGVYQLAPGEDLSEVAARFGMNQADLKRVNGLGSEAKSSPGFALLVPLRPNGKALPAETRAAKTLDAPAFTKLARQGAHPLLYAARTHTVKKGETLWGIARRYQVSVADLKRMNKLKNNSIRVGSRMALRLEQTVAMSGRHPALFALNSGASPVRVKDAPVIPEERIVPLPDEADLSLPPISGQLPSDDHSYGVSSESDAPSAEETILSLRPAVQMKL